jgi:competence protein ComEC
MAALCLCERPRFAFFTALLAVFTLGMGYLELGRSHPAPVLPQELENREVAITGFVIRASIPVLESSAPSVDWHPAAAESYQQVDLRTEKIVELSADSDVAKAPALVQELGVRVGFYQPSQEEQSTASPPAYFPQLSYGQHLLIRGRIRTPQTYQDPGVFDRRQYLLDNGIAATLSVKAGDIETLPDAGGTRWGRWRAQSRMSLLRHVLALQTPQGWRRKWRLFSISRADAALLAAMILGERSLLDQQVKTDFQRTGSYHLLVVSGMAVAILAFSVFWLARLAHLPDPIATLISVVFVALYVSMTDLGAPVQRAALMCAVYMLARLFYRERNPLNAISAAALVVLVIDPKSLFDAGFQMTFLAVLSITGAALPIMERTSGFYRKALYQIDSTSFDLYLEPKQAQFRLDLRMVLAQLDLFLPRWMARFALLGGIRSLLRAADVIFVSALLQAALALPMAVYFHRATTLALPANLVVVPIMSLLLPTALATTLLSYLGTWVIFLPRCLTALLLHSVSASIFALARFRAADIRVPDPPIWAGALCIGALIACIFAARTRRIIVFCTLALLAIADWGIIHARKPDLDAGKLEITAIDVGQGDSLLIVTPQGKSLLIDGGGTLGASNSGFDVGEDVVSPYLWARGFSHLDAVALSHPHGDHIGGLPAVLNNFHPAELWVAPAPINPAYESLIRQAKAARVLVKDLAAGDRLQFGGASIDVLAPFGGSNLTEKRGNDDSMVLKISFGATSALLEGDAERHTERLIAPALGPVNLLKVAHHGSSTSSISELINAIRPQFAVISVGQFNRYGHPRPEVLERLRAAGACTYRTDFNGAVSFYLDGTALTSARWGRQRQAIEFPSRWIPPNQAGHCAALR